MPALTVSAWLDPFSEASLSSLESHAGLLARVYPLWYGCGPAGLPRPLPGLDGARGRILAAARAHGVELWPLVSNYDPEARTFDPAVLRLILGDQSTRKAHIAALLQGAARLEAQGVDLHYENLYPSDRSAFVAFAQELCAAFRAQGLKVAIALRPRTGEAGALWAPSAGDTVLLAAACDVLQVLGWDPLDSALPGPLAQPGLCAQARSGLFAQVPADKLEWGLPGFGREWNADGPARDLGWTEWDRLVLAHAPARRDPASVELGLAYAGRRAWMNDAISLTAKLWRLREQGLAQAAVWILGAEDPRLWALIDSLPKEFLLPA
jgi:spore germination protein YaaH